MKKLVFCALMGLICFSAVPKKTVFCFADTGEGSPSIFSVFDENNNKIFESDFVEVGDIVITKDLKQYEVLEVHDDFSAYAEYNGSYSKPKVVEEIKKFKFSPKTRKSVGIYMTHNDESYVPTDGTESIFGEGGIHDVAGALASCFKNAGYEVFFDQTLHIPHDKNAYARSASTANALMQNSPDAIFDIHRNGASRATYVKKVDGVERCKVRIVVGQANPNKDANLQFAMYLMTVAEQICPWLFLDIYYAKGHYNQALSSKALLFEMGSHLVEKDLVLKTVPALANVVDKTLFSTIVSNENTLVVTNAVDENEQENLVTNVLAQEDVRAKLNSKHTSNVAIIGGILLAVCVVGGGISYIIFKKKLNKSSKK